VISSFEYEFDNVGNVTSITDKDSLVTSYTFDDIYQLTDMDYPSGNDFGYQYDAVGNRTKMFEYTSSSTITTTYTYDHADEFTQWTTSTVTMTFTYASDGCLVSKSDGTDTWQYVWDYEGRLTAFKKNSATLVEYAYSPTGTRRYSSDSTLGLTNYFYSGGHVLADYSSNWSLSKSYIMGPKVDEIIAMIDRTADPNITHYFMRDRLGSTRELVNASETVNTRYAYDVWGAPTETKLVGNVSTRYQFTGRSLDPTSGLYYYRARHYDHGIARFTSRDPLYHGARRHVDSYVYVGNNPATMVDPFGLWGVGDDQLGAYFSMVGSLPSSGGLMSSLAATGVDTSSPPILGDQAGGDSGPDTRDWAPWVILGYGGPDLTSGFGKGDSGWGWDPWSDWHLAYCYYLCQLNCKRLHPEGGQPLDLCLLECYLHCDIAFGKG